MSTAACSVPVRALIRLDLPELTSPTGPRSPAAWRPSGAASGSAAGFVLPRGLRERPAVRVGPSAKPAAVHFDQVKAHLPHEAEINHGQQFLLDSVVTGSAVRREDQNRAMLTGFISIEATHVAF